MTTKTEEFAIKCCARAYGLTVDDVKSKMTAGAVDWIMWVELVMTVLQAVIDNCPQRNLIVSVVLGGVSRWQKVRFRRLTYDIATSCGYEKYQHDAGTIANVIMSTASAEEEEVLTEIVHETTNPDNWLF